jgi:hypothetical protein
MNMKHSYYDDEHKLFIACVECKRGYFGQRDCSAGWQHKVFKGQGCFNGELIRPKCPHGESAEQCPFINNQDGDCLNDDGFCDTYSYNDMALKIVEDEMNVSALQKNRLEKEYKNLVKECESTEAKLSQLKSRIEFLVGRITEVEKAGLELGGEWVDLDRMCGKTRKKNRN